MTPISALRLDIYPSERADFFRSAVLFAAVFFFFAIFRNYVDAAFIKRHGPQGIPLMLCLGGAATLVLFRFCRRLGDRVSHQRMLTFFFLASGLGQFALYYLVRAGADAAYPLLYLMLQIQDAFLLVYLWNLVQSVFDARQGRRIFRLVLAAQVFGGTLGSLATQPLAALCGIDTPLAFCAGANLVLAAALAIARFTPGTRAREEAGRAGHDPATALKAVVRYPIFRFLCVCSLVPNLILPILTYQFGVVAHAAFVSDQDLLGFLGWFRGATMLAAFAGMALLGPVYNRLPGPRIALAAPVNQLVCFAGLGLFFNLPAAAYAQFSTIFLQRAALGPLTKQLFSLLPDSIAAFGQIFARGLLTQAGTIAGALLLLALKDKFPARELSLAALILASVWTAETLRFGRRYAAGLKQVLAIRGMDVDLLAPEEAAASPPAASIDPQDYPEDMLDLMAELDIPDLDPRAALAGLEAKDPAVRAEAAASFALSRDPKAVYGLVSLLDDTEEVSRAAVETLSRYAPIVLPVLEQALVSGSPRTRRGILEAMRLAKARDADLIPFIFGQLTTIYDGLIAARTLESGASGLAVRLLVAHLREMRQDGLFTVFRALWVTHADMRLIFMAVNSRKAAAAELLETILDPVSASWIVPLVDSIPEEETVARGRRVLPLLRGDTPARAFCSLCASEEPTTRWLAHLAVGETYADPVFLPLAGAGLTDPGPDVRAAAFYAHKRCAQEEANMPPSIFLVESLRRFAILNGLGIRELRALASVSDPASLAAGTTAVARGQTFPGVHLVASGRVEALPAPERAGYVIAAGELFGLFSLFSDAPAEHDYVVSEESQIIIINPSAFLEIMKLYPLIGINLCRYFTGLLHASSGREVRTG